MGILSRSDIETMGFAYVGEDVFLSDKASFYNCPSISIASNVRIDDFCVISSGKNGIKIGSHVHIAVYSSLIGAGEIIISDFCNISSRVSIYSSSDDFSGCTMTSPVVPDEFKNVSHAKVFLGKHVVVGCGSVILPGVEIAEGVAIGALSLVRENCNSFGVYVGTPARWIKKRECDLLELEKKFISFWVSYKTKRPLD
jgi:dTDP-4-amino-4,6-dideoxy-D-glucose acyltransferase